MAMLTAWSKSITKIAEKSEELSMKTVEKLVASDKDMKLGNHRLEIQQDGTEWYYYHATPIIKVDWLKNRVTVNDGGWGTVSTTRSINAYLREIGKYMTYDIIDMRGKKSA